jgi:hypothetical protein
MKFKAVFILGLLVFLSGCFRVGRMPIVTESGPGYDNPKSAILVPIGSQTQVLSVNRESARPETLDWLANLSLTPFLMYLEPQISVKPGKNVLGVRALDEQTTNYGSYSVKTTTWRDYTLEVDVKPGQRYYVTADLDSGVSIKPDQDPSKPLPRLYSKY